MPDLRRFVPGTALSWPRGSVFADEPAHRQVDGTLVFVDVSGFTALSERLAERGRVGAEQLTDVLNRVFAVMLGLANARGGSLLKFGGDALFLLFTGDDHPAQAASAAVEMRSALAHTAKQPSPAGRLALRMSVGVHSGKVDLFLVGQSHRELVIAGPATTAVAELEGAASAGQILLGSATSAALPASAVGDPLGPGHLLRWRKAHAELPEPYLRPQDELDVGRFVPMAMRAFLGVDPDSEHRTTGVSFVRYTGLDGLLATRGPGAVAQALHSLVVAAQQAAADESVTFLATDLAEDGGKVILVSGFPSTAEDDLGRLLRATRTIVQRSLDESWPLAVRAGVNRGHVFAGAIGSAERATATVMGDTVNLAARVMAKAEAGQLLATPSALDNAQSLFDTEPVEPFMVKGKSRPVTAYVVGEEAGTRPPRGLGSLPFRGRDDELALVRGSIEKALAGVGGVVSVLGDAGMGKTRLLKEALSATSPPVVMIARAEPYGVATPYRPVRDPMRRMLGLPVTTTESLAEPLVAAISAISTELVPFVPLLGDVMGIEADETPETRDLDPRFRPDRTADAVMSLIAQAIEGPLVVAFDDVHYADDATAGLAERFERETERRPWLMLAARREDGDGYRPTSGASVSLGALDNGAARQLVLDGTEATPLRPGDVDTIVARAGGNPLFVEETLRNLREHGDIDALPSSLEGMVAAQIDTLSPLARRVVRRASVLGRSFRIGVLQDLFGEEDVALDDTTQRELADVLESDGAGRLRFRHALLRDAAYNSLPFQRRRDFHQLAAESTLRRAGGHPEAYADNLALHFSMSGDHESTWQWARVAADQARDAYANADAALQYRRALSASDRLHDLPPDELTSLWESLGDVLLPMGRYAEAIKAYTGGARASASDNTVRAALIAKRARAQERAQRFPSAYRDLSVASKIAQKASGPEARQIEAQVAATRAYLLTFQDRYTESRKEAEKAIQLARTTHARPALARAYVALETSLALTGSPTDGANLERALLIYQELNDVEGQSTTLSNLGAIAYWAGDWATAEQRYEQAAMLADRIGDVTGAAISRGNLAEILVNQGRLDDAQPILEAALRTLQSTGLSANAGFVEVLLARTLTMRGQFDEAQERLDRLRAQLLAVGQPDDAYAAALAQAENCLASGKPSAAMDLLHHADEHARHSDSVLTPMSHVVRAEALHALGRVREAADAAEAGLAEADAQGLVLERALLTGVRARVDARVSSSDAHQHMARAESQLLALGLTSDRVRQLLRTDQLAQPAGPRQAARS